MVEMWAKPSTAQACSARRPTGGSVRSRCSCLLLAMLARGRRRARRAQTAARPRRPRPRRRRSRRPRRANTLALLRDDKRRAELMSTLETIAKAAPAAAAPGGARARDAGGDVAAGPLAVRPVPPHRAPRATAPPQPRRPPPAAAAAAAARPRPRCRRSRRTASARSSPGACRSCCSAYAQQLADSLRSVNDLPLLWRWLVEPGDRPGSAGRRRWTPWRMLLIVLAGGWRPSGWSAGCSPACARALVAWSPRHAIADPSAPGTHATEVAAPPLRARSSARCRLIPLSARPLAARSRCRSPPSSASANCCSAPCSARPPRPGWSCCRPSRPMPIAAHHPRRRRLPGLARPRRGCCRCPMGGGVPDRLGAPDRHHRVTGYAVANIGLLFGMYHTAQLAILKLFALVVHLCLVVAVLQARGPVAHRLQARRGGDRAVAGAVQPVRRRSGTGSRSSDRRRVAGLGGRDPQRLRAAAHLLRRHRRPIVVGRAAGRGADPRRARPGPDGAGTTRLCRPGRGLLPGRCARSSRARSGSSPASRCWRPGDCRSCSG